MNNTINDSINIAALNAVSMGDAISTTTTCLATAKEYREAVNKEAFQFNEQWSEQLYQCPKCGGGMCKNLMVVLTSYPEQYEYKCNKCGHIEYQYG